MSDRVNQKWKIQGSRVYGQGYNYNLTSKIDAERLCSTLNKYEHDITLEQNISKQYDKLTQQIISLQMDLSNVQDTLNKLKETIHDINSNH